MVLITFDLGDPSSEVVLDSGNLSLRNGGSDSSPESVSTFSFFLLGAEVFFPRIGAPGEVSAEEDELLLEDELDSSESESLDDEEDSDFRKDIV